MSSQAGPGVEGAGGGGGSLSLSEVVVDDDEDEDGPGCLASPMRVARIGCMRRGVWCPLSGDSRRSLLSLIALTHTSGGRMRDKVRVRPEEEVRGVDKGRKTRKKAHEEPPSKKPATISILMNLWQKVV